jgi:D-alanyl-D-alanine dipeptidase
MKFIFALLLFFGVSMQANADLPKGFVFLTEVDPSILESVRYYGSENFMGRPVPGYALNRIVLTEQAALALQQVNTSLKKQGYKLVVYDAYRPQTAVNAFIDWSKHPEDRIAKALYYPTLQKNEIFEEGYISPRSQHTRGSTVDLTLIRVNQALKPIHLEKRTLSNHEVIPFLDDNTVDMGASFDLFHRVSHHQSILITPEQQAHRDLLRKEMEKAGFQAYDTEWWHYLLKNEPFPETYFDFSR